MKTAMDRLFIRMIIWMMKYDIALAKDRLADTRETIAQDEAVLQQWQRRLLALEMNRA